MDLMKKTLAEIAKEIQGRVVGDGALLIKGICGIKEARPGDLTFLANPRYLHLAATTAASAIIVGKDVLVEGKTVVQTEDPSAAFSKVVSMIKEDLSPRIKGVHPTAVIDPTAVIGQGAGIGPHVVVEKNAKVGRNTVICAGCFIGQKTIVGEDCLVYPNVTLREDVTIGNKVIIHSGTVVGADGFGYALVEGVHTKIPQMGTVVIEDDVEIGACVTIDRARFDKTFIGRGTKIDNLVQIGHNAHIGRHCIIIALAGVAGSCHIGDHVIVAGQAGMGGHLNIGDGASIAAQSGVIKDVPPGAKMFGTPAKEYKTAVREMGLVSRLPQYIEKLESLENKIKALEEKLK
jgi:UDP-3-O-[3-hydroxymyristoyl] glucosamine N-acyltransferase